MFLVVDGYRLSPWDFFTPQKLGFLGPPEPELHLHRIQQNSRFATSQVSICMLSFSGSTFFHSSSCQILPDSARFWACWSTWVPRPMKPCWKREKWKAKLNRWTDGSLWHHNVLMMLVCSGESIPIHGLIFTFGNRIDLCLSDIYIHPEVDIYI